MIIQQVPLVTWSLSSLKSPMTIRQDKRIGPYINFLLYITVVHQEYCGPYFLYLLVYQAVSCGPYQFFIIGQLIMRFLNFFNTYLSSISITLSKSIFSTAVSSSGKIDFTSSGNASCFNCPTTSSALFKLFCSAASFKL